VDAPPEVMKSKPSHDILRTSSSQASTATTHPLLFYLSLHRPFTSKLQLPNRKLNNMAVRAQFENSNE
jgi:hypothetical protein